MSHSCTFPTPYAPINAFLRQFVDDIRSILGNDLVGFYLSGSLAVGDFDPTSSDIDFVAVLSVPPDEVAVTALKRLHDTLGGDRGKGIQRLEGFYVPLATVRQHDPTMIPHPAVYFAAGTRFDPCRLRWDWVIECYVLQEHGIIVDGPPPATLIDPISRDQLIESVRATLRHDWSQHIAEPEWMRIRHEQAFAILTMCRALYVLERGELVSKLEAAHWAQRRLAPEWRPLIERALAWRADATLDAAALCETLRFLRFTLSHT